MFRFFIIILIFWFLSLDYNNAEVFSSTYHLELLADREKRAAEVLQKLDNPDEVITRYLDEYKSVPDSLTAQEIAKNPIHAYFMIKRLNELSKSENVLNYETWKKLEPILNNGTLFPSDWDRNGAEFAIVFLAAVHFLDIDDLSRGKIRGQETNLTMEVSDYLRLLRYSIQVKEYDQAIKWFQLILKDSMETNDRKFVDIMIFVSSEDFYNSFQLVDEYSHLTDEKRRNQSVTSGQRFIPRCDLTEPLHVSADEEKKLICYYSDQGSPWLILQPAKIEVVHPNATFLIFHDVISDKEIEILKELSVAQLERVTVSTRLPMIGKVNRIRKDVRLSEFDHEIVGRLARRMSHITGLSLNVTTGDVERLNVFNYGLGGWHEEHYDYRVRPYLRDASIMFWLSNVEMGGGTGFPYANLTLYPRKNSAAFWYNLDDEGKTMIHAFHGACPVLIGNKWVATFWAKHVGQIFKRKCPLQARRII
ncbi:prolyl 4-hydroxylase subunit alpha-2-like [Brevipalpus obovatus]|uniref:prolyl 4-hydroxylase subunit alpha-2-like n=1 Tax=Brevipalpus obovatus TaxID=246614 RepID=UPI003D9E4B55